MIGLIFNGVARAVPWVAGYFIADKVTDGFGKNASPEYTKGNDVFLSDLDVFQNNVNRVQSAPNNGYELAFGDILKWAMLAGVVYVGFKALNEGKKLI